MNNTEKFKKLETYLEESKDLPNEQKEKYIEEIGIDTFFDFINHKFENNDAFNKYMKEYLQNDKRFLELVKNKDKMDNQQALLLIDKFTKKM